LFFKEVIALGRHAHIWFSVFENNRSLINKDYLLSLKEHDKSDF